jgi:leucyl aminopeptidase
MAADRSSGDGFTPVPSIAAVAALSVTVDADVPSSATAVGVVIGIDDDPTDMVGISRDRMNAAGFGAVGSTLVVPGDDGAVTVAVGAGDGTLDAGGVRDVAAAFARAAATHGEIEFDIRSLALDADTAAQAAVEGILLARYRYDVLRRTEGVTPLTRVTIVSDASASAGERGRTFAAATMLARDLANSPHSHLSASKLADLAEQHAASHGLTVEVFDKEQLVAMGCGGLLGVNAGSAAPPRMIKLHYEPTSNATAAHLGLVGKGIMYDSGGLALKPGDEVHAQMKNDMSGAAAVFAAMLNLGAIDCRVAVTAWLMCTDNMPSGTAMALGDVLTIRGGTTVEVINTDAEGRLVMADALVLATEEPVDAVIDIATLTGACMRALGTQLAGVMGNDQSLVGQVESAARATGESVWQLPLDHRYRKELDSNVADLRNLGGANAGAITAALFLAEFVGDLPWAHIDIAGTAQSSGDAGWQTAGCTGFGARLLLQLALDFETASA